MSIPTINTDSCSLCMLDHAPDGTSRLEFIFLRRDLCDKYNGGYPLDAGHLDDDEIMRIAQICARLRNENTKYDNR